MGSTSPAARNLSTRCRAVSGDSPNLSATAAGWFAPPAAVMSASTAIHVKMPTRVP
ncbi:MAG: hypothetical protein QOF92_1912 [Pseudonocardiales bacterium]|nr:hypothetical protein [Pseudonocardiales bacterium]